MSLVLIVFIVVYLGMMLGHLPGLKVDRASIALGGAIALLATAEVTESGALAGIDFGTIGMLFGLMLISIQLELSGLYGSLSMARSRRPGCPRDWSRISRRRVSISSRATCSTSSRRS